MIAGRWGHSLDRYLKPLAKRLNINPNILTIVGFLLSGMAGGLLSFDLFLGGLTILLAGLFDMLDGIVARVNQRVTASGAYLDSVLDRYSDAFVFSGLAWYLREDLEGVLLSLGSMIGAFLVSYTRARAEGLGKDCKVGIMERPERILLLSFGCLTGWIVPTLWVMFSLTHFTVLQRIYYVLKRQ
ncbi:MAG: CDP-alcohol phosphatidyltransferase family protein [Nitrospirae bacterium]|nr:CDP-alcohol phosphatidyltransferase family protein [Nitrospirota bacterium]